MIKTVLLRGSQTLAERDWNWSTGHCRIQIQNWSLVAYYLQHRWTRSFLCPRYVVLGHILISNEGTLSQDGYRSFVLGTWWGMSYSAMMLHSGGILISFCLLRVIANCVIGDYVRDWDLKIFWYWICLVKSIFSVNLSGSSSQLIYTKYLRYFIYF